MTYKTTKKDLDKLEEKLNQLLGYPTERDPRKYSIGNIYYQGVADYWNIEQVVNSGLGAKHLEQGLRTKREVEQWFKAAIFGIEANQTIERMPIDKAHSLEFYWTKWPEYSHEITLDNPKDRIGFIWKFTFKNNYGLTVARHNKSYHSDEGFFETFKTVRGKILHEEERILEKADVIERIKEIKLQTLPL